MGFLFLALWSIFFSASVSEPKLLKARAASVLHPMPHQLSFVSEGNNSRSFSLSLDKLSSCTSKQSWLLNDCSPKQINSSRTPKALGWWGREEAAGAVELGAGPCWAQPAGDRHRDVLTSPSPKLWGSGWISGIEKVKKNKARRWVIDGILFTGVLTSHKSHGFDVIS